MYNVHYYFICFTREIYALFDLLFPFEPEFHKYGCIHNIHSVPPNTFIERLIHLISKL